MFAVSTLRFTKQNALASYVMHWHPMSVPLHTDVKDWNERLTDSEKNLLVQIFRLFTQSDVDVASGYVESICNFSNFQKLE